MWDMTMAYKREETMKVERQPIRDYTKNELQFFRLQRILKSFSYSHEMRKRIRDLYYTIDIEERTGFLLNIATIVKKQYGI